MNSFHKKHLTIVLFVVYVLSYWLQSWFFLNQEVFGSEDKATKTNIIAMLVDKDIYPQIKDDVSWYATDYIQQKIQRSKVLVLPVDTKIPPKDLVKILENLYFEGEKSTPSKLAGLIMVGNIPLPMVNENGFLYPSVMPLVDFENQQFIYDPKTDFFVDNKNPNGQAEIWHGKIDFAGNVSQYTSFFTKLKTYYANPSAFVAPKIWYDDLIAIKKSLNQENLTYYVNNFLFSEDISYHRITNAMLDWFKNDQNAGAEDISAQLAKASGIAPSAAVAEAMGSLETTKTPTLMLAKVVKEFLKNFDVLMSTKYLSRMRDNIEVSARRSISAVDTFYQKIMQKDARWLGDSENNIQPLLLSLNTKLENVVNQKIEKEQYAMQIPIVTDLVQNRIDCAKILAIKYTLKQKNIYKNFYFGTYAGDITNINQTSIYRGSFPESPDPKQVTVQGEQSIGSSQKAFDMQIEANRGYNILNSEAESKLYSGDKNYLYRKRDCVKGNRLPGIRVGSTCFGKIDWNPSRGKKNDFGGVWGKTGDKGEQEMPLDFAFRNRGGASPLNLNQDKLQAQPPVYELLYADYTNAWLPVYDMGGAQAIASKQTSADSYAGASTYGSLILTETEGGDYDYPMITREDGKDHAHVTLKKTASGIVPVVLKDTIVASTYDYFQTIVKPGYVIEAGGLALSKDQGKKCGKNQGDLVSYKLVDSVVKNIAPMQEQMEGAAGSKSYLYNLLQAQQVKRSGYAQSFSEDASGLMVNMKTAFLQLQDVKSKALGVQNTSLPSDATTVIKTIQSWDQYFSSAYFESITGALEEINPQFETFGQKASLLQEVMMPQSLKTQETATKYALSMGLLNTEKGYLVGLLKSTNKHINETKMAFTGIVTPLYTSIKTESTSQSILPATFQAKRDVLNQRVKNASGVAIGCAAGQTWATACQQLSIIKNRADQYLAKIAIVQTHVGKNQDENGIRSSSDILYADTKQSVQDPTSSKAIDALNIYIAKIKGYADTSSLPKVGGMNMMTMDRPVDSERNISFQGIGNGKVRLAYPNLYKVPVFTQSGGIQTLKTIPQIEESIKIYLKQVIVNYNTQLQQEQTNAPAWYAKNKVAFDTLKKADPLASPVNRNYQLFDEKSLIDEIGPTMIHTVAELLWYTNSPITQKKQTSTFGEEVKSIQSTYDINKKIAYSMQTYLQENNDQGPIITPQYNASGYEAAFINSDGADYIPFSATPAFITQLNESKSKNNLTKKSPNMFLEDADLANILNQTDPNPCGSASSYLIFDLNSSLPSKSPWMEALKCRRAQTAKDPADFSVRFENNKTPGQFKEDLNKTLVDWQESSSATQTSHLPETKKQGAATLAPGDLALLTKLDNQTALVVSNPLVVDSKKIPQIKISVGNNVGTVNLSLQATGQICNATKPDFDLNLEGTSICSKAYTTQLKTSDVQSLTLNLAPITKAGFVTITATLCLAHNAKACIEKNMLIDALPGPVVTTSITTPSAIMMAGADLPVGMKVQDVYGNSLLKTIETYKITSSPAQGQFLPGSGAVSAEIQEFERPTVIYRALATPANVTFVASGRNAAGVIVSSKKTIQIKEGFVTGAPKNISYTLTESSSESANYPKITITIQDKDKNRLDNVLAFSSTNGLFTPGTINAKGVFEQANQFISTNGVLTILLKPNFQAGKDTITLSLPGASDIVIPVTVLPGAPYKTDLLIEQETLLPGASQQITTQVLDHWGNKISPLPPTLKIGVMGAITLTSPTPDKNNQITITAGKSGGYGYLYGYLSDLALSGQIPASQQFLVQQQLLPETGLNVAYLTLLGTDRGSRTQYMQSLFVNSSKLLAITTQQADPAKLKKTILLVSEDAQIKHLDQESVTLSVLAGNLAIQTQQGDIALGNMKDFDFELTPNQEEAKTMIKKSADQAMVFFPQADTDTQQDTYKQFLDQFSKGDFSGLDIHTTQDQAHDDVYTLWEVRKEGNQMGQMFIKSPLKNITTAYTLFSPSEYLLVPSVFEGGTNGTAGYALQQKESSYEAQGYSSVQNSTDEDLGIGFSADFKNLSLFADGKRVGESTLPFGSQFLINLGDPLFERISKNEELPNLPMDLGIGKQIYADPTKTIFKTLPVDANNDGLQDLILVYTDGTIRYLKNEGGNEPFVPAQDLMKIATSIKEVLVGDVDGNNYPDLLLRLDNNTIKVYKNTSGIFDVDGSLVCLNTNAKAGEINKKPDNVSAIKQIYFEDMDQDKRLDIVTLDTRGDIKIFYGGSSKDGANYLSNLDYACDDKRYQRQEKSTLRVQQLGIMINPNTLVQDQSLMHVEGRNMPADDGSDYADAENEPDNTADSDSISLGGVTMNSGNFDVSALVNSASSSLIHAANQSLLDTLLPSPVGEDSIGYKALINLSGTNQVSAHKTYEDLDGGVLLSGDTVKIVGHIRALGYQIKLNYIERLDGPWQLATNASGDISSLKADDQTKIITKLTTDDDAYIFEIRDLTLKANQEYTFSYEAVYQGDSAMSIKVKDEYLEATTNQYPTQKKDGYLDIIASPQDACQKMRTIYFNLPDAARRAYTPGIIDNIQEKIDAYIAKGQAEADKIKNDAMNNFPSTDSTGAILDQVMSVPGVKETLESRNVSDMVGDAFKGGFNTTISMDGINKATAGIEAKMDSALAGLCQGFKLGKAGCGQPPVPINMIPFNQAFLFPGQYHIMGCQKMNLSPLNKGMPLLFLPGYIQFATPPYIPVPGSAFVPITFKGSLPGDGFFGFNGQAAMPSSQFRLYMGPTLTMQMGMAICVGPYTVGAAIPNPAKAVGGNCIVTTFPLYGGSCNDNGSGLSTEEIPDWMNNAAEQGSCTDATPSKGNAWIESPVGIVKAATAASAFQLGSLGKNITPAAFSTQGNVGGFGYVKMNAKPTKVETSTSKPTRPSPDGFNAFTFKSGEKISLKILGANAKGIMKVVMQDWFGRQIKYILNNLTKFTVGVTLPKMGDLGKGFDQLFSADAWSQANTSSKKTNLTKQQENIKKTSPTLAKAGQIMSRNTLKSMSDSANNPFESLLTMFEKVPLVNITTKQYSIKVPMIYTEDITSYSNYLQAWVKKQEKIMERWIEVIDNIFASCVRIPKQDAQMLVQDLKEEKSRVESQKATMSTSEYDKLIKQITKETTAMQKIIDGDVALEGDTTVGQDMAARRKRASANIQLTAQRVTALPIYSFEEKRLLTKKAGLNTKNDLVGGSGFSANDQQKLDRVSKRKESLQACASVTSNLDSFLKFQANIGPLISSVKQNIIVLEQYKNFPSQLYGWMHVMDKYMGDVSSLLSSTVGYLMGWINENAKIYANFVDALVLVLESIKTWQALMDFSINRGKKCSKCTSDSYGSMSCSLSILLKGLKFPILPIPPFKIPNIYIDLSHIDLGMAIQLPQFNFIPTKLALPQLPDLPLPPEIDINVGLNLNLDLDLFGSLSLPKIPVLPSPPKLPDLPSFIPKITFKLPKLPPAPQIPNLIPNIKVILDNASIIAKIFCIVKSGLGLVAEKGVKDRVEQMSQRTRDVPYMDLLDKTVEFGKDKPLQGFDFKLDSYLTFKMDFGVFDGFLTQVISTVNNVSNGLESVYSEGMDKVSGSSSEFVNNLQQDINKVNVDLEFKPDLNAKFDRIEGFTQLNEQLAYFKANADDADTQQKIASIKEGLNTRAIVTPATKEIAEVRNQATHIISENQKEIRTLAEQIQSDYPKFLKKISKQGVLIAHETQEQTLSAPLFHLNPETKKLLANAESPSKSYLDLNARLINGYKTSFETTNAENMGITQQDHAKTLAYLSDLDKKTQATYDALGYPKEKETFCAPVNDMTASTPEKTLLAQASTSPSTSTTPVNSTNTTPVMGDISSFVQGVFVEKSTATGTSMINVVQSSAMSTVIGKNTKQLDMNNDGVQDLLMWDAKNVYIKYGKQEESYEPKPAKTYNNFYSYALGRGGNNRYISSYEDLHSKGDLGWFEIEGKNKNLFGANDTFVAKLTAPAREVKNFKLQGQSFDDISFSWTNAEQLGDDHVAGYLIKLNQRVDTNHLKNGKNSLFNWLSPAQINQKYILMLPNDTSYENEYLAPREQYFLGTDYGTKARKIQDFLTGSRSGLIYQIGRYDPSQEKISVQLSEIPRNWQYAEIVPLMTGMEAGDVTYFPAGPWSNQIVGGRQLLADTQGPVAQITLVRPMTKTVQTGNALEGTIGTNYTLTINRKDNLAVSKMWLNQGEIELRSKTGLQATGVITLPGLYFTGAQTLEFSAGAEDVQGNQTIETIQIKITPPDLEIIDQQDSGDIQTSFLAQLSQDIDEGLVTFQRGRDSKRTAMSGTKANTYGGYPTTAGQTIVTGAWFSKSQVQSLYNAKGQEIATIPPQGTIHITSGFETKYTTKLSFVSGVPSVNLIDKQDNSLLFSFYPPSGSLDGVPILQQGKPWYELMNLDDNMKAFAGGYCLKNTTKACIIYLSPQGSIFVPKEYTASLGGILTQEGTDFVYQITDVGGKNILKISVTPKR